jgi:hypothetical protein
MPRKTGEVLIFLIGLALFLRLVGISHDLPFVFHPDEPTIVRSALGISFSPNPAHFDWPHLYIYLNYFVFMFFATLRNVAEMLNFKQSILLYAPIIWDDNSIFYLITRIFTAVLGAFTLLPIYLTAKNLFNEKVGILSAFVFAVIPYHAWQSHYSLPDVPMIFFFSWALYYASNILTTDETGNYIKSGFFTGLAASTKYNGGLAALFVPIAHLIRIISGINIKSYGKETILDLKGIASLIVSGLFAVLAFVLGTPFAILDNQTFMRTDNYKGAMWQFANVGHLPITLHLSSILNNLIHRLPDDLGYTILLGYFAALIIFIVRLVLKKSSRYVQSLWFIFIPSLIFLYYISGFEKQRSQYFMIMYPFFAIAFGYFLYEIFIFFETRAKILSFLILAVLLFPPFYFSMKGALTFNNGDTRSVIYDWAKANISKDSPIIFNDSTLSPVITKLGNPDHKGYDTIPVISGYVFVLDGDVQAVQKVVPYTTEIHRIDNSLMLGPSITVYHF